MLPQGNRARDCGQDSAATAPVLRWVPGHPAGPGEGPVLSAGCVLGSFPCKLYSCQDTARKPGFREPAREDTSVLQAVGDSGSTQAVWLWTRPLAPLASGPPAECGS